MPAITTRTTTTMTARIFSMRGPARYYLTVKLSIKKDSRSCQLFRKSHLPKTNSAQSQIRLTLNSRAVAYGNFRRLDRGPQARAERPCLHNRPLIVETRSLRSALRAPVETTEIAIRSGRGVRLFRRMCWPRKHHDGPPPRPSAHSRVARRGDGPACLGLAG